MTSFRQIEANRRNACKSTGPVTEEGKQHSRCNAVRHGLTAETVIGALEDAEDYKAFEAAIIADYDVQSAVERELVLRLASLLWRLRPLGDRTLANVQSLCHRRLSQMFSQASALFFRSTENDYESSCRKCSKRSSWISCHDRQQ
jgi:hypothetical protein